MTLRSVGGQGISVASNDTLVSVDGLGGIAALSGGLSIDENPALPTCNAEALADRLRENGWEGTAALRDNCDTCSCE